VVRNASNCSRVANRVQDCAWALPWTRRVRLAATPDGMATRRSRGADAACWGSSCEVPACSPVVDAMWVMLLCVMVCSLQTLTQCDDCVLRVRNDGYVWASFQ